jgi:membrane protein DedA with SNARE-associated domain
MPLWRFTAYTAAGCIPWVLLLGIIGVEVGSRWEEWRDRLHYFDYVVLAGILALIVYFLIRRRRGASTTDETSGRGEAEPAPEG